jgi:hypothetical protein
MPREQAQKAAEAMNYLGAIMNVTAAGLRYSYAKFVAYGRIVALGCKELFCNTAGGT